MKQKDCQTGCLSLSGGDIRHHKDCKHYPESLAYMIDVRDEMIEKLTLDNLKLTEDHDQMLRERDEADRRAGAAERRLEYANDTINRSRDCNEKRKADAGYHRDESFDIVWAETFKKAQQLEYFKRVILATAVSAIYFNDGSDYLKSLWQIVKDIDLDIWQLLQDKPREAWEKTHPENQD